MCMDMPKRKSTRLKGYDYSQNGGYFVTICAHKKKKFFSRIVGQGLAPAEVVLTSWGEIAQTQLKALANRYQEIQIDRYVIMPNHIHILFRIEKQTAGASPCPTISDVVCAFKSLPSRICHQNGFQGKLFQSSFHDHIIRDEHDYEKIWEYIENNPLKWELDCFYVNE